MLLSTRYRFLALYLTIWSKILAHLFTTHELLLEAAKWVESIINYTVPGRKLNRGVMVLQVHQTLTGVEEGQDLTNVEIACASVLGGAIEFL